MRIEKKDQIEAHIRLKTPLKALGGLVRHFEERYEATGAHHWKVKAKIMREVITSVFLHRYTEGQYID